MNSAPVRALVLAAAALCAHPALADDDIPQQPHRAVYEMGLGAGGGAGGPGSIRGVMYYEVTETCEAWRIETKVLLRTAYGEDEEAESLRTMATWESKDGLSFRFRVDESAQGKPGEAIRGVAVLDPPGPGGEPGAGIAEYTQPRAQKTALPKGTLFPTAHMIRMIAHARAGAAHFTRPVFDGSTLDDPFEVSTVIGPAPDSKLPPEVEAALAGRAEGQQRWEGRLAYFPVAKAAETPEFELTVVYRDDGIVEFIRQEYEDHAIDSRLRQIELLPRPACPDFEEAPPIPMP